MNRQEKIKTLTKYAQDIKDRLSGKVDNQSLKEFLERDLIKTERKIAEMKLDDGRAGKL